MENSVVNRSTHLMVTLIKIIIPIYKISGDYNAKV